MIVERDLPRRTAVQQVSHIYWNHQDSGSIRSALDKAFDVEAVTKEFFEEYKRVFDLAIDRVEGFGSDEDEQESKKLFVQTLFNRLMFIYFLSRKGWLTFRGDKDYLNALWRDYEATDGDDENFHVDRLRLLFFAGLVHRFRRRDGEVRTEVVYVDRERRIVRVRMDGREYGSLSGAAKVAAGTSQNGWVYWGLKKQAAHGRDG